MGYPKQTEVNEPRMAGDTSRTIVTLFILALLLATATYCALSFWGTTTIVEPGVGQPGAAPEQEAAPGESLPPAPPPEPAVPIDPSRP